MLTQKQKLTRPRSANRSKPTAASAATASGPSSGARPTACRSWLASALTAVSVGQAARAAAADHPELAVHQEPAGPAASRTTW